MRISDFDRIVCITVDTRFPEWPMAARREVEAKGGECSLFLNGAARAAEIGPHRYRQLNGDAPAGYPSTPGNYHLARAFLSVVGEARRDGLDTLLVVEDDLKFTPECSRVTGAIRLPDDWRLFYLGANHSGAETFDVPGQPHLLRVEGSHTTHAVGLHARAFDEVIGLEIDAPIDVMLARLHRRGACFAAWPQAAIQRPGPSTLWGGIADYRDLFRSKGRNRPPEPPEAPAARVGRCEFRGSILPLSLQPEGCGCAAKELTECRAGKGKIPGRVTTADCLACVG